MSEYDPDQALADYEQGNDEEQDTDEGVYVYTDEDTHSPLDSAEDHGVSEEMLELYTALEAQKAGML